MNAIDEQIGKLKYKLFTCFVNKWSKHTHAKNCRECNLTVTLDGNWKIKRRKWAYVSVTIKTKEFRKIITGCRAYPCKNSYFCKSHQGKDLIFNGPNSKKVCFTPNRIKITRMRKFRFVKINKN